MKNADDRERKEKEDKVLHCMISRVSTQNGRIATATKSFNKTNERERNECKLSKVKQSERDRETGGRERGREREKEMCIS